MRAVIRKGESGVLAVGEMPAPTPLAGQVLCRTLACGICGSDLHALDHYDHMIDLTERLGGFAHMKKGADTVFGHEFCCEIVDFGPQTERRLKAGTPVVSIPGVLTEGGFETVGYSSRLPGGFAQSVVLTQAMLLEVPNGLSPQQAALTEPLAVGEHAVAKAEAGADHAAMVVGLGPVGLAVIAALKRRGLGPVIACDFSAERRAAAQRLGADRLVDPAALAPHTAWADFAVPATRAEAMMAAMAGSEARRPLIFECVGAPGVLQALAETAPPASRIVVAGVCMQTDAIEPLAFVSREIELRFVLGYSAEEFADSLRALAEGTTGYNGVVTKVVGLEETPAAFTRLQTDKSQIKILVTPNG
ncbi:MAG TPA: zinc-binding dehydrogenase [Caulobacteraceae bacterium]|nr:zinc-binding dehydrogenase [Caulobacteraceae bacterium]